jgi:choline kinase
MKAIILAAGEGLRMGKLTQNIPKPLMMVNGKSIIERQLSILKQNKILDVIIVTGSYNEKFNFKNVVYVNDLDHKKHDTLGSLMTARDYMNDEIIITYADQIFDEKIIESINNFSGDIGIAVDLDWEKNYVNRDQHPKSEAENILINGNEILEIRKNILACKENEKIGECLGLMKFSRKASKVFLDKYSELEISHQGKFHNASSLEKALISDMIQELIDSEINIEPIYVSGKWCEIDTPQDLEIARKMFEE